MLKIRVNVLLTYLVVRCESSFEMTLPQEYILMEKPEIKQFKSKEEMEIDWQAKENPSQINVTQQQQKLVMEAEVDHYILFSSIKNFQVDCRQ